MVRTARCLAIVALSGILGCMEQEPQQPTAEDLKFVKEHILKEAPAMKYKVDADLEGKATYLGLDVDPAVITPGVQFTLTHYWKVHTSLDGWKLFVHINDPGKKKYTNADHKPIEGRYPVSVWKPGEIIRDIHKVTIPRDWGSDKAIVYVGLWQSQSVRMKVKGKHDGENRIMAATIDVKATAQAPKPQSKRIVATKTTQPVKIDGK
ncbi:MAG: hypothetical protein V1754_05920, partial [Pseudomonadota bacterium]